MDDSRKSVLESEKCLDGVSVFFCNPQTKQDEKPVTIFYICDFIIKKQILSVSDDKKML